MTVDDLIHDLGAVVANAAEVRADAYARQKIDEAIQGATLAIGATIRQPDNETMLAFARQSIERTSRLVESLDTEYARSRRLESRALGLRLDVARRREGR